MSDSIETQQALQKVRSGDREAFRLLVREHSLMIRSYLGSQLHRVDEMDDLAQEVFLKAFRNLEQYESGSNFRAWLRGIARNELRMHFRAAVRRHSNEANFREAVSRVIQQDLEHHAQQQTDAAIESLLRCVSRLPERMRRVVRAGLDGQKAKSVAAEMSSSVGAVYNLHYRANELLRQCVQKEIS
ncbi:sigma-70 family RNA polymerase sigma factor [Stieleria sp. TO1_6]|uniref:RNA polymerase sigma factor n=1 Tax=Stieleria tagensis TaxID=2956795 RepID=UPI00209AEB9E|nr:sigma-70 family RNA polymerase sigma factor [Stieleria tagensis]MCO8120637.1 sigma-70 family RNA polymerase sigma factor [Stieleria tagensis]